ncbi:hypothetical protein ACV6RK_000376 [Cronobacter malonaticus]
MTIDTAKLKTAAEKAKAAVADYQSSVIDAAKFYRRAAEFHRLTDSPEQMLELIAALEAAEKRNAELEARTVKLPPCVDDLHGVGMVMSADAVTEALSAACINLETGGES